MRDGVPDVFYGFNGYIYSFDKNWRYREIKRFSTRHFHNIAKPAPRLGPLWDPRAADFKGLEINTATERPRLKTWVGGTPEGITISLQTSINENEK